MSEGTNRPSVDAEQYQRAELHCVGQNKSPNQCFKEAFELLFKEDGDKIEGVEWLYDYAEVNDVEPRLVLERILTKVLDDDGEMNIQFKERIKADEVEA